MRVLGASSGLFTLALRDESSRPSRERGAVRRVAVAVAASLVTGPGMVRRRARATPRGQGAMRVPRVDPTEPRRLAKTLIEPLARTEAGRWWLINVSPKLDGAIFRLSGGRFTSIPAPILTLVHTGARTGKQRENLLTYFTDGDDLVVMASNYGRESHPGWYYNIKVNPDVEVRAAGQVGRCRAQVTTGDDRERLWAFAKRLTRTYGDYEQRALGRTIQVVRLRPVSGEGP